MTVVRLSPPPTGPCRRVTCFRRTWGLLKMTSASRQERDISIPMKKALRGGRALSSPLTPSSFPVGASPASEGFAFNWEPYFYGPHSRNPGAPPFIVVPGGGGEGAKFSAWDYAKERCRVLCGQAETAEAAKPEHAE
jgi:hypothetical protein